MGVVLSKGGSVSLVKQANRILTSINVGLGWDPPASGPSYDLDASVIAVDASGRAVSDSYFIFYNQLVSPDGSIVHHGDDPDGSGSDGGDDEQVTINLQALPEVIAAIRFFVTIHEGELKGQTFGQLQGAYIRVADNETGSELARFDLADGAANDSALIFAEVRRDGGDWRFQAIGDGYRGGLAAILGAHGISV